MNCRCRRARDLEPKPVRPRVRRVFLLQAVAVEDRREVPRPLPGAVRARLQHQPARILRHRAAGVLLAWELRGWLHHQVSQQPTNRAMNYLIS